MKDSVEMNENKDLFFRLKKVLPGYSDQAIQHFINWAETHPNKPLILYTGSVRHKDKTNAISDLLQEKLLNDLPGIFKYKNIRVYDVNEFGQIVEEFENRFDKLKQSYPSMRNNYPKLAEEIKAMHKKLHMEGPSYKHLLWAFYDSYPKLDSYPKREKIWHSYKNSLKESVNEEEIAISRQNVKLGRKDIKITFEIINEAKLLKSNTDKSMTKCMETACENNGLSKKALIKWWCTYWKLVLPEDIKTKYTFSTNKESPVEMFNKLSVTELKKCWEKYKHVRGVF